MKKKNIDLDIWEDMNNDKLAQMRTYYAEVRSDLARNRTIQAAERTYAAWVRTGFSMAGVGWTFGTLLQDTNKETLALILGGGLIILGIICFIYGWIGFRRVYKYLETFLEDDPTEVDFLSDLNMITVSILTISLVVISILGYGFLIF
ncbi:DUF202 domain-containing protein [Aerococcaceae bacterium DSM 111020]|nr:DUF202 domain-containing protein [Aerococcaceae bacterium DSM 111020]